MCGPHSSTRQYIRGRTKSRRPWAHRPDKSGTRCTTHRWVRPEACARLTLPIVRSLSTNAVILGLDPRTHSSAVAVLLRGRRGVLLRGGGWGGLAWVLGSEPEDDAEWGCGVRFLRVAGVTRRLRWRSMSLSCRGDAPDAVLGLSCGGGRARRPPALEPSLASPSEAQTSTPSSSGLTRGPIPLRCQCRFGGGGARSAVWRRLGRLGMGPRVGDRG